MPKAVQNPKKHIISCRINDDELTTLKELARCSGTSISGLLRLSLGLLASPSGTTDEQMNTY